MALPGTGYRTVGSLLIEIGLHLIEPFIFSTLTSAVAVAGISSPAVASLGYPVNSLYPGAMIVVDGGTPSEEEVTITAVNVGAKTFTALFLNTHAIGASVVGATFPTQAMSGDQFFTQTEVLSYIARAQHEFLAQVPHIFSMNQQTVKFGQVYQSLTCDAIEMHRVASSAPNLQLVSLTRVGGVVTAISQSPHGLVPTEKFSILTADDPSFQGAFRATTILSPTSWTYPQQQPNATNVGGLAGLWLRLYETSQQELSIQNPVWRSQNITELTTWGEDRTGNYQFFVGGKPSSNFPLEVLCTIRDTDTLNLTDFFAVPDIALHFVKYKALEFCWTKDGEQRNPQLAKWCAMRFERGVLATKRFMDGVMAGLGQPEML